MQQKYLYSNWLFFTKEVQSMANNSQIFKEETKKVLKEGVLLYFKNEIEKSEECFQKAIEPELKNEAVFRVIINHYYHNEELEKAEEYSQRALEINAKDIIKLPKTTVLLNFVKGTIGMLYSFVQKCKSPSLVTSRL